MADRSAREERRRRWRERLALVATALFPLLVASGFLAPGLVRVLAVAQEAEPGPRGPVADLVGPFAKRPLALAGTFGSGTELVRVDHLFIGSQYRIEAPAESLARVTSFQRSHGDTIVIDDDGQLPQEVVFEDILVRDPPMQVATLELDPSDLLPLCGTLHAANCVRDDDFTTGGVLRGDVQPIPEPSAGALLALGLAALGARRRVARR
jgi:hypothetical protein